MSRKLLPVLLLLCSAVLFCQDTPAAETVDKIAEKYCFENIPWGTELEELKSLLSEKGFDFEEVYETGDILFKGEYMDTPCYLLARMASDGGLQKIEVFLDTPDEVTVDKYREVKKNISDKYGEPFDVSEIVSDDFITDDGTDEVGALKAGEAVFASYWMEEDEESISGIALMIEDLVVIISYEGQEWLSEVEQRQSDM